MTKITYIPGEIANAAIDEHGNRKPVTRTQHIFDDSKGKSQAEVNADIDDTLALHQSEINALDSQNYVTVDTFGDLPSTGALDTIYRVANYDGTQVVTNKYAEYSWNGTQYKLLDVKDYGIDDEPINGSVNLINNRGVLLSDLQTIKPFAATIINEVTQASNNTPVKFLKGHTYYILFDNPTQNAFTFTDVLTSTSPTSFESQVDYLISSLFVQKESKVVLRFTATGDAFFLFARFFGNSGVKLSVFDCAADIYPSLDSPYLITSGAVFNNTIDFVKKLSTNYYNIDNPTNGIWRDFKKNKYYYIILTNGNNAFSSDFIGTSTGEAPWADNAVDVLSTSCSLSSNEKIAFIFKATGDASLLFGRNFNGVISNIQIFELIEPAELTTLSKYNGNPKSQILVEGVDYEKREDISGFGTVISEWGTVYKTYNQNSAVTTNIQVKKGDRIVVRNTPITSPISSIVGWNRDNNTLQYNPCITTRSPIEIEYIVIVENDGYVAICYDKRYSLSIERIRSEATYPSSEMQLENIIFRTDILGLKYVGSFNAMEECSGIVIDDKKVVVSESVFKETVKGYVSYLASPEDSGEFGDNLCIAEFNLQEPSERNTHVVFIKGDTLTIDNVEYTIDDYTKDPVLYNYSSTKLFMYFRTTLNGNGCLIGMFVSKNDFSISGAFKFNINNDDAYHYANTEIVYYDGYYYLGFTKNPYTAEAESFIGRSQDLINWETYLDLSDISNVEEIAVLIDDGIMFFALRDGNYGRFDMSDEPISSNITYLQLPNCEYTRPALASFNGQLYYLYIQRGNVTINGTTVMRARIALVEIDKDTLGINKTWSYVSNVGGNYGLLKSYKSQLLIATNMNKQGIDNSNATERCGVYFGSLSCVIG